MRWHFPCLLTLYLCSVSAGGDPPVKGEKPHPGEAALAALGEAIARRDYKEATKHLTGDYQEYFEQGHKDAALLAKEIDSMRDTMKAVGIKSAKVDMILYWLDPFPAFKYVMGKGDDKEATATINWRDDKGRFKDVLPYPVRFPSPLAHSLLPDGRLVPAGLKLKAKKVGDSWKVELPVKVGDRHMRSCVQALDRHATNLTNSIRNLKTNIKNNPAVKVDIEREFKANIEKAVN